MLVAAAACSSLPSGPRDLLDERTGATVTVAGAPLTFSRRLNGQSFPESLTLVAIRRDDDGKYTEQLLLYHWFGFVGPVASAPQDSAGELLIEIDGRSIELHPLPHLPAALPSPKDLYVPDTAPANMRAYDTDLETMRLIATSHELTVGLPEELLNDPFELVRDGRTALAQFLEHVSAP
jgi:hypothetical protein